MNDKKLDKLKKDIQGCNTTAQVDVVIKEHGLSDIEGLPEHIKELYKKGEIEKLETGDINGFIQTQNYQNIADAAHGYSGVKQAIDAYNESLQTAKKVQYQISAYPVFRSVLFSILYSIIIF